MPRTITSKPRSASSGSSQTGDSRPRAAATRRTLTTSRRPAISAGRTANAAATAAIASTACSNAPNSVRTSYDLDDIRCALLMASLAAAGRRRRRNLPNATRSNVRAPRTESEWRARFAPPGNPASRAARTISSDLFPGPLRPPPGAAAVDPCRALLQRTPGSSPGIERPGSAQPGRIEPSPPPPERDLGCRRQHQVAGLGAVVPAVALGSPSLRVRRGLVGPCAYRNNTVLLWVCQ